MRGLLVLALILAVAIFLLPFILGFVIFILCALAIFMLLARFGLLPGTVLKTYTFTTSNNRSKRRSTIKFEDEEDPKKEDSADWQSYIQNGEVITLPETALKKEETKVTEIRDE